MASESGIPNEATVDPKRQLALFLTTVEKAILTHKVFSHNQGGGTLDQVHKNLFSLLNGAFGDEDEITVHLKPFQVLYYREPVYENRDRKKSLAHLLFEEGVRGMRIRRGISEEELQDFVALLATDFKKPEFIDQDLASLLFEKEYEHIETPTVDLVAEQLQTDDELKKEVAEFSEWLRQRQQSPTETQRRVRPDDLKVLEEFRMNARQFSQSDDEVVNIIQSLASQRGDSSEERQTLERLGLMAFHFLISEENEEERAVGRDLITQVAVMTLEAQEILLFSAILKKLYQLQKDRPQQRGEYQKAIDAIFSPEHYFLYKKVLKEEKLRSPVLEILKASPTSAVRMVVFLLGELPQIQKEMTDYVLANLPEHHSWLLQEVEIDPARACWEPLLRILSLKPNAQFGKFLTLLMESSRESVRAKILRLCAVVGTPETLKVFEPLLASKESVDRMQALQALSLGRSVQALKIIREYMSLKSFANADEDEKQEAYASILRIGREAAQSWLQTEWMRPGEGLFKSKSLNQRRVHLLKACLRVEPKFVEGLLQLTPIESLTPDCQALLKRQGTKGESS